ncbi:hypothetical protein GMD78_01290 [Ornithinibacillus sp. L9]|uniref:Uncharacterized protein n=1 Tax=Ornithinibacillus caprae TaxID=2678566 RepID=A0A6N8FED6_9BACI|nr:hypothetical protein [Ornithinibacillus caprae]MUK87036.1 hypothetical protein [Ornithinibacillus caprae]
MAILDDEIGQYLNESSTYISAQATFTVNLWFLPQIIDIIDNKNMINGRVEGNRFSLKKKLNFQIKEQLLNEGERNERHIIYLISNSN